MKEKDALITLSQELVTQQQILILSLMNETDTECECSNTINDCTSYVCDKLQMFQTAKRRTAQLRLNSKYVEPETKSIGVKWKTCSRPGENIPDHKLIQANFSYVSLLKTLTVTLSDLVFRAEYVKYNNGKHKCENGVFKDFCCGSLYQNNEFFHNNPNALQIELSSDDFDVCSELKSKATIHKVDGIYFRIRNMPPHINSKLNSIYLIALCEAVHLKSDDHSIEDINRMIVNEMQILETKGVEILPGEYLKGTLVNTSNDNLGANGMFGYVECFQANYPCRLCSCLRDDMQQLFVEDVNLMRTKAEYNDIVKQLEDLNINSTTNNIKGIKRYCAFNDLSYYHMLDNKSVDLMHDLNEGKLQFLSIQIDENLNHRNTLLF